MAETNAVFYYDRMLERQANTVRLLQVDKDKKPEVILTGFYTDDFHMTITNQWQTGDSTIVKQLVDTAASHLTGRSGKVLNGILGSIVKNAKDSGAVTSDSGRAILDNLDNGLEFIKTYQNASYFTADDFFKSFKGTSVVFPTNMRVTLVSDESGTDKDIYRDVKRLLNVSIGEYGAPEQIGGVVGIQAAPNGFQSGASYNINDVQNKGTLKIIYGDPDNGGYTLPNMVISNVRLTFSKTKVEIKEGVFRPLYIEIDCVLEPSHKFTKKDLVESLGMNFTSMFDDMDFKLKPTSSDSDNDEKSESVKKFETELNDANKNAQNVESINKANAVAALVRAEDVDVAGLKVDYNQETDTTRFTGTMKDQDEYDYLRNLVDPEGGNLTHSKNVIWDVKYDPPLTGVWDVRNPGINMRGPKF